MNSQLFYGQIQPFIFGDQDFQEDVQRLIFLSHTAMKILNLEMLDNCLFSPQISVNKLVTIALNVKIFFKENDIQNAWIFGKIPNGLWSHPYFRKIKLYFLKIHAEKALFQTVQNV